MENSIIGKEFTFEYSNVVILDEAIINRIDDWNVYISIVTSIGNMHFKILDLNTYFNHKSIGMLNEDRVRILLPKVFNEVAKFKEFRGAMAHDLMEYKDRFSIYIRSVSRNL